MTCDAKHCGHRWCPSAIVIPTYRLCLLWANGKIAAVQRLHADTDREALAFARETVKEHAGLSGFELWEGARKVVARGDRDGF